jgi:hypothetical protein
VGHAQLLLLEKLAAKRVVLLLRASLFRPFEVIGFFRKTSTAIVGEPDFASNLFLFPEF